MMAANKCSQSIVDRLEEIKKRVISRLAKKYSLTEKEVVNLLNMGSEGDH